MRGVLVALKTPLSTLIKCSKNSCPKLQTLLSRYKGGGERFWLLPLVFGLWKIWRCDTGLLKHGTSGINKLIIS